jgi:hypothetical protein
MCSQPSGESKAKAEQVTQREDVIGEACSVGGGVDYIQQTNPSWRLPASLWDAYEKEMKAAKTSDAKQMLESGQHHECDEFDDELLSMDSIEIGRRASRCYLSLYDVPLPEGETTHWETGNYGARYIHPKTLREFTKTVEAAEYERAKRNVELKDFWLKIFTAMFAAAAAVASIINLFAGHKH